MASPEVLVVNARCSPTDHLQRLTRLRQAAEERFAYHGDLIAAIRTLADFGEEIIAFAHQYDFRDVQANGYRSLFDLGCKLFERGLELTETDNDLRVVSDLSRAAVQLAAGVEFIRKLRSDTKHAAASCVDQRCPLQTPDDRLGVDCFFKFIANHDSEPFYGKLVDFTAKNKVARNTTRLSVQFITSIWQNSLVNATRCWTDEKFRAAAYAELVKNVDIYYIKYLDDIFARSFISEKLLPMFHHGVKGPAIQKTVFVDKRQSRWLVICDPKEQTAAVVDNSNGNYQAAKDNPVRCRVLLQPDDTKCLSSNGLVLFNCHGGGMCARCLSNTIPNIIPSMSNYSQRTR